MKVFLIIVIVLAVIIALIMSLTATLTVIYEDGWHTTIQVLTYEKDFVLSEFLSFIIFPEKKAEEARRKRDNAKKKEKDAKIQNNKPKVEEAKKQEQEATKEIKKEEKKQKEKKEKPNYFAEIWEKEGIVGIMSMVSNLFETGSSAVTTLFRGFHIYSFYVKMIIGGEDAADIAEKYGMVCSFYYPLKGIILNGMKVDLYDDYVQPDFIAPRSEYGFQLIGSLSVGLIVKILFKAGAVFLKNFIKDK